MPVILQTPPRTDDWREVRGWRQNVYDILGQLSLMDDGDGLICDNFSIKGTLYVDTIEEYTAGAGVTTEGVHMKDGNITMPEAAWIGTGATHNLGFHELSREFRFTDTNPVVSLVDTGDSDRNTTVQMTSDLCTLRRAEVDGLDGDFCLNFGLGLQHVQSKVLASYFHDGTDICFSIAFWAYPTNLAFGSVFGATWGANKFYFVVDAGFWSFGVGAGSIRTTVVATINVWQHVVYVGNPATGFMKIWVDGVLVSDDVYGYDTVKARLPSWGGAVIDGYGCYIGDYNNSLFNPATRNDAGGHAYFVGKVDDLRVYNTVLTQTDVDYLYNGGAGRYVGAQPGQLGGWHFDEGEGYYTRDYVNSRDCNLFNTLGTPWIANHDYSVSDLCIPTTADLPYTFRCIQDNGNSGPGEPVWPDAVGDTIVDGDIIWKGQRYDFSPFWDAGVVSAPVQTFYDQPIWSIESSGVTGTIGLLTFGGGSTPTVLNGKTVEIQTGTDTALEVTATELILHRQIRFHAEELSIYDIDSTHVLGLVVGSDLTADRNLFLYPGDADRSLTFEGDAIISQDYSTDGDVQFGTITTTGVGTFGSLIVSNGGGVDIYEDLTWLGATGENLLQFPTNLPVALEIGTTGVPYQVFDSTTGALQIEYFTNQYVITQAGTTAAINAAIDSGALNILLTAGGTVDATITIDNDYTSLTAGWGGLLDASAAQAFHIVDLNGTDYGLLDGLRIKGKAAQAGDNHGIMGTGSIHWTINDCWIENADHSAVWLTDCDYTMVTKCRLMNPNNFGYLNIGGEHSWCCFNYSESCFTGLYFSATAQRSLMMGNISHDDYLGIQVAGWAVAQGNIVDNPSTTGLLFYGSFNTCHANMCESPGQYGVYAQAGQSTVVSSNLIHTSGWSGFYLRALDMSAVTGNVVYRAANTHDDFRVNLCNYTVLANNVGESALSYSENFINGISSTYCLAVGNVSKAHGTASIALDTNCSGWVIGWNRLESAPVLAGAAAITNIVQWEDTSTMLVSGNYGLQLQAEIGARDTLPVLIVKNLEDTAGDSQGILVWAGSDGTDWVQQWCDRAGQVQMTLDGLGHLHLYEGDLLIKSVGGVGFGDNQEYTIYHDGTRLVFFRSSDDAEVWLGTAHTDTLWAGTVKAGTCVVAAGSITDSSGAISFGNENLSTTGTLGCGAITSTGASQFGNVGIGAAPSASYQLYVTGPAVIGVAGYTQYTGGTAFGIYGYAHGVATYNIGVYGRAENDALAYNHHFQAHSGAYCTTDWFPSSMSDWKSDKKNYAKLVETELYDALDDIRPWQFRYKKIVGGGELNKKTGEMSEIIREDDPTAPLNFGFMADEGSDGLPDFLRSDDRQSWSPTSGTAYSLALHKIQKAKIEMAASERAAMQVRIEELEAKVSKLKGAA